MKKRILIVHLLVICIIIGAILGVSFGIIFPEVNNINNYQQTTCILMNYSLLPYNFCYQICNTTIPNCDLLLNQNISGPCYNSSDNYDRYKSCYVNCDTYYIVNILYNYEIFSQTIEINCGNNQLCINNSINSKSIDCYYNRENPNNLQTIKPKIYQWEFIIVIVVLCVILVYYIVINLTIFKKYIL
ncbi:hypothetical protein Indivirus_1_234 [Indivirus ILV1]|uniref:Transmembrane protein n=1 Tax=Indivirus ILV1 TaxID=1977633 RepID=A0A1V0SD47_9VIRU|nr:hypothetical protein Indivirus_1_234 [Indivirus ILV1]